MIGEINEFRPGGQLKGVFFKRSLYFTASDESRITIEARSNGERYLRNHIIALALAALAMTSNSSASLAGSIGGTWSGDGYVEPSNGQREAVRCRVTYSQQTDKVFGVSAVCASPSAQIRQTGEVLMVNPERYVGDFYNSAYDISGRVNVSISGNSQTVSFKSASGHGSLSLSKR
ncbi:MAG: hypothetical protein APF80_04640 [Alphaproteobacteria bacterium BRH_c36]|nr:MAG: hypothetical protein APF80_04640 [Alphaproteobacteria bacterium BRH_c36]